MRRVVLDAIRKRRGLTVPEVAALCRREKGGEKIRTTNMHAYLSGRRAIGRVHFLILCKVLRVKPDSVMVSVYLAGRSEEVAA